MKKINTVLHRTAQRAFIRKKATFEKGSHQYHMEMNPSEKFWPHILTKTLRRNFCLHKVSIWQCLRWLTKQFEDTEQRRPRLSVFNTAFIDYGGTGTDNSDDTKLFLFNLIIAKHKLSQNKNFAQTLLTKQSAQIVFLRVNFHKVRLTVVHEVI